MASSAMLPYSSLIFFFPQDDQAISQKERERDCTEWSKNKEKGKVTFKRGKKNGTESEVY